MFQYSIPKAVSDSAKKCFCDLSNTNDDTSNQISSNQNSNNIQFFKQQIDCSLKDFDLASAIKYSKLLESEILKSSSAGE